MKKLFKILAVLISLVMILSIFAGCNGTTGDGAGDGAGSGDGSTPDTDGGKDDTPGGDKTDPDGGELEGNNIVVSESGYYIILIYPESEDYCQISMHLQ